MQYVTIAAQMQDGTIIIEKTADFGRFVDLTLAFHHDPDCTEVKWLIQDVPPLPVLRRAVSRAARRPGYLAATLGSDVDALAAQLDTTPYQAFRLALCRLPARRTWDADLTTIAAYAGVDRERLAALLVPAALTMAR